MNTRFLLIVFFTLISSIVIPVFAVPELDPAQAFEYSDYVVLGKIIAVDIISDPVIHKSEKTYSEKSGVALYDITVVKSYKNPDNRTLFTIPGYFLYEPHAMSYNTYPYEVGQIVVLYIQKNTDENVEGKLIIRPGDSRLVSDGRDPICKSEPMPDGEGWVFINCNWEQYVDVPVENCQKGKTPASNYAWNSQDCLWEWNPLRNENSSGPTEHLSEEKPSVKLTDDQICGSGEKLVDGICINPNVDHFDTGLNPILLFVSIGVILSVVSFIVWRKRK